MKTLAKSLLLLALFAPVRAQNVVGWVATTGDTSLSAAGTTATVQATGNVTVTLDKIVVYCSAACTVTQAANGTNATTTTGTVQPLLPESPAAVLPLAFFTASNVGTGTNQGGIVHIPAGLTVVLCLSTTCTASQNITIGTQGQGVGRNYSVSIGSLTGTVNITFYGRVSS